MGFSSLSNKALLAAGDVGIDERSRGMSRGSSGSRTASPARRFRSRSINSVAYSRASARLMTTGNPSSHDWRTSRTCSTYTSNGSARLTVFRV